MRILITGGTGFLGSNIATQLIEAGHDVTICARNIAYAKNIFPKTHIVTCDFLKDTHKEHWIPRLNQIDIVINCVGILHHPNAKKIWRIHYETPRALFDACLETDVKKIIQISALGVDKSTVNYATSKKAAEDYLSDLNIPSVILRPSLVYGQGSYGGTSLFRGLSAFPFVIPIPGNGQQQFQPIHLNDLAKAIIQLIERPDKNTHLTLSAVGPDRITLSTLLLTLRAWLSIKKTIILKIPLIFIRIGSFFGNFLPNSTMNTDSYQMLSQNNIAIPDETKRFIETIGFTPAHFTKGLYQTPSAVQDRWHARLYFLKPLLQYSIAFIWLWSGITNALLNPKVAFILLDSLGISSAWQSTVLYGASFLDILLGLATLFSFQIKKIGLFQFFILLGYTILASVLFPFLWLDPFGVIAKNIPILVAILIMLAMESDR